MLTPRRFSYAPVALAGRVHSMETRSSQEEGYSFPAAPCNTRSMKGRSSSLSTSTVSLGKDEEADAPVPPNQINTIVDAQEVASYRPRGPEEMNRGAWRAYEGHQYYPSAAASRELGSLRPGTVDERFTRGARKSARVSPVRSDWIALRATSRCSEARLRYGLPEEAPVVLALMLLESTRVPVDALYGVCAPPAGCLGLCPVAASLPILRAGEVGRRRHAPKNHYSAQERRFCQ